MGGTTRRARTSKTATTWSIKRVCLIPPLHYHSSRAFGESQDDCKQRISEYLFLRSCLLLHIKLLLLFRLKLILNFSSSCIFPPSFFSLSNSSPVQSILL